MRILIQIGYSKSFGRRREGQIVKAYVNDDECSWSDGTGRYLTSKADAARGKTWYLWEGDVSEESTIKIEVKTSLVGIGTDENRTFESLYYVNKDAPIREINAYKVGERGYPLIKGRIMEIGSVSESDKRRSDIDEFLRGEF